MKSGHERPVNSLAARVVSRGESFEYRGLETEVCSSLPISIKELPEGMENLVGRRFGRLVVSGWIGQGKGRWSCRCQCGNYVVRRAKAIWQAAPDASCQQCYLMAVSKRKEFIRRTGKQCETREFLV